MREKYKQLVKELKALESVCIAFSGGVDSTYLLDVAQRVLGERVIAVTVSSSMCPQKEQQEAFDFATKRGIKHLVIKANEYEIPEFVENNKERCYFCKKAIFSKIKAVAEAEGVRYVADGSNKDDEGDYRPGMRAIKELGIRSPLKDVGLTKNEIRALSRENELPTWDKPAMACLASRIPYGKEITPEKLQRIEKAEDYMMMHGFRNIRVRYYEDLAKIEVPQAHIPQVLNQAEVIYEAFKRFGFTSVAVDLIGYRMGSMNEVLKQKG